MTRYQLDLCDNFARIGQADAFDFAGVLHRNDVGEWQATIPDGGATFDAGADINNVDSIILWEAVAPARIVYAGSIAATGSVSTGLTTTHGSSGRVFTLSGVDLFGLLGQRIAYPNPLEEPPWSTGYDTRTGAASTVAAEYITANMGSGALPDRQIPGVTVLDSEVGDEATWSARLQPLSTLVAQICKSGQIICRPTMTTPGEVRYSFATGQDRTEQTVISEFDLTGSVKVTEAQARATIVVAGGDGELTDRKFRQSSTGATGLDRLESFYDVSTLTTTSSVLLAATGARIEAGAEVAVDFSSLASGRWRYLDHFDIGDTLTVEVDDVRYPVMVDGVSFTVNPSRSDVRPLIGRTTNNEAAEIMRRVWGSATRFNNNIS